ncbi:MAG: WYL domain-containing protein [Prevotellaceae bacterium]|jgi:predicted DNA-binding transcriptional regulator YafY|nr:WYL domain-containing protein [Prevotellaceae bacterium]
MSNNAITKRHSFIIKKIKKAKRVTFEEINDYLQRESEIDGYYDYTVSMRTFSRDLADIGTIYGIYIKYDFSGKFYYIEEEDDPETNDRMFEAFDMYHVLKVYERHSPYFHLEKRSSQGAEHLLGLLYAVKNSRQIRFNYRKYYKEHHESRTVEPLTLKEFKSRWYIFAKDLYDGKIKCYALDRISDMEISDIEFVPDEHFDVNEELKYCFGIISPNADKPSKVVLSFDSFQGKYAKSLPLHDTQEIIKDTDDELQISLTVYLTHDFLMELLSYGNTVKIIEPKSLIEDLKNIYKSALEQYD